MRWCSLGLLMVCTAVQAAERPGLQMWTTTETRHVLRSEPPGDSLDVKLFLARNEWRGFQVLLRSDAAVPGIRVGVTDFRGPDGETIPASGVRLYRQHQLELKQGTYRNTDFKPDFYPDPLIPFADPVTGKPIEQAQWLAQPLDLPAGQTHGFWIDVYAPADAKAGVYRGAFRLGVPGRVGFEFPIEVTVWNFTLPATPTLISAFGSPAGRLRGYYAQLAKAGKAEAPKDWAAVEEQCADLLAEHRMNATPPGELLRPGAEGVSYRFSPRQIDGLRKFIDRHHVNAIQTPHPSSAVKDPDAEKEKLREWLGAFDRMAKELDRPEVVFYTYLKDEPNTLDDYRYVQKWGRAVKEAKSVVKVMVVEQTWTERGMGGADSAWGDLYGAVDIWCPLFSLHRPDSAEKRMALGEMVWTYTALCQGKPTPWWHIDYPLLNYRVPAWMAWRNHMSGLLYWGGMSYWKVDDPWTEAPYYTGSGRPQQGEKGIIFNGEGSMVYPADAVGYAGIVPTIRLKALRDSIEDFEYLSILQRSGRRVEADRIAAELTASFFSWQKDPAAYDAARRRLGELIPGGKTGP